MKPSTRSIVGLVVLGVCGCNPTTTLISDGLNVINEYSDSVRKVVDEPSAGYYLAAREKQIKEKWETYKKRVEKWIKDHEAPDLQEASAFLAVDRWQVAKLKGKGGIDKGAIELIFGQQSGELDKHFMAWLTKKNVSIDKSQTSSVQEAIELAAKKGVLDETYKANEAWFRESLAAMRNVNDAKNRVAAAFKKNKGEKLKDVAGGLTFPN